VLHPLRTVRLVVVVVLCLAVGVLDEQAFQQVPFLHSLDVTRLGHAVVLVATGLLAGFLLRSWWALGASLLAYLVGFAATSLVLSAVPGLPGVPAGSAGQTIPAGSTSLQHLPGLLATAGGAAVLVPVGAGVATALMKGWIHLRRRQPPSAEDHAETGAPVPTRAGRTPLR
jgi:hypothetical protein